MFNLLVKYWSSIILKTIFNTGKTGEQMSQIATRKVRVVIPIVIYNVHKRRRREKQTRHSHACLQTCESYK